MKWREKVIRRRRRRSEVASQTRDFISDIIWAAPSLECLRDRLREIVQDTELWKQLEQFDKLNKSFDRKLVSFMNRRKK
jgi:hypothetical protein